MNSVFDTYRPEGFTSLNLYLFVSNPQELIDFLKNTFYAQEIHRTINPDNGDIGNCIMKIGDTCFMISQARGQFLDMHTSFYLYVNDVDAVFERSIKNGAEKVFDPADMDYGDRQGGIKDPSGNYWWISKRLQKSGYDE